MAVINVAMQPMKGKAADLIAFEDSIAKKDGFISYPGVEGFVQLLYIRNCQWITISNLSMMQKVLRQACIYDSSYSMSERPRRNYIHTPFTWKQMSSGCSDQVNVLACVLNVQQRKGRYDCSLFAIAYAVQLCLGKSPIPFSTSKKLCALHWYKVRRKETPLHFWMKWLPLKNLKKNSLPVGYASLLQIPITQ